MVRKRLTNWHPDCARSLSDVATITRSVIKGEMRLIGLDDSVTVAAVAREGNCEEDEVKPGSIRPMFNGLGSVWLQCSLQQ